MSYFLIHSENVHHYPSSSKLPIEHAICQIESLKSHGYYFCFHFLLAQELLGLERILSDNLNDRIFFLFVVARHVLQELLISLYVELLLPLEYIGCCFHKLSSELTNELVLRQTRITLLHMLESFFENVQKFNEPCSRCFLVSLSQYAATYL